MGENRNNSDLRRIRTKGLRRTPIRCGLSTTNSICGGGGSCESRETDTELEKTTGGHDGVAGEEQE